MHDKGDILIEARNVSKTFTRGESKIKAVRDVQLTIGRGSSLLVLGPSGSGKSTLLHMLGALDSPTSGELLFRDTPLHDLKDRELSRIRNRYTGFVFQSFHLLGDYTAFLNVQMPLLYYEEDGGNRSVPDMERVREVLEFVGLGDRMDHKPSELSGGERQRVAIARALATDPDIILADEPTGNLDTETGERVMRHLQKSAEEDRTLVMVSHDPRWSSLFDRVMYLEDGLLTEEAPDSVKLRMNEKREGGSRD